MRSTSWWRGKGGWRGPDGTRTHKSCTPASAPAPTTPHRPESAQGVGCPSSRGRTGPHRRFLAPDAAGPGQRHRARMHPDGAGEPEGIASAVLAPEAGEADAAPLFAARPEVAEGALQLGRRLPPSAPGGAVDPGPLRLFRVPQPMRLRRAWQGLLGLQPVLAERQAPRSGTPDRRSSLTMPRSALSPPGDGPTDGRRAVRPCWSAQRPCRAPGHPGLRRGPRRPAGGPSRPRPPRCTRKRSAPIDADARAAGRRTPGEPSTPSRPFRRPLSPPPTSATTFATRSPRPAANAARGDLPMRGSPLIRRGHPGIQRHVRIGLLGHVHHDGVRWQLPGGNRPQPPLPPPGGLAGDAVGARPIREWHDQAWPYQRGSVNQIMNSCEPAFSPAITRHGMGGGSLHTLVRVH